MEAYKLHFQHQLHNLQRQLPMQEDLDTIPQPIQREMH